MTPFLTGMKVRYLPQPEWGVGHLLSLEDSGTKAMVSFPARDEGQPILVSTRGGGLSHVALRRGDGVRTTKGIVGVVLQEEEGARGLRRYLVQLEDGRESEYPETELRALKPKPDLLAALKEGRVADAKHFVMRRNALRLDDERRNDALGALLASRVMVKPHQVGVVQRVLSARRPRFILADEVGLGKTIEAGMVFSALRVSGLARRVLVVAPSHLTVQWLVELFHKFNHLFTLMDSERFASSCEERPDVSPWIRFDLVVTSLELLQRSEAHRDAIADPKAHWDLVIFDEAHHLKGDKAYQAAKGVAANCWGLLLLTATPMQLDPSEYQALLSLIDPSMAPTVKEFEARLKRQEALSKAVRGLLAPDASSDAAAELKAHFPADVSLQALDDPDDLLAHLAETYSLSDRLIRNRRSTVGGFSTRRLHRHPVTLSANEIKAREQALSLLSKDKSLRGAALASLIRRLESSPAAFHSATRGNKALMEAKFVLPSIDSKFLAFKKLLRDIWTREPDAKLLVFTEARDTLEALQSALRNERIESLGYHGDLALQERDRQVARFRDVDGPKILIATEVGGEGRNFQFSHHLIHYDLPWSPAAVEQRIGRLDRIGQTKPVDIHVFDLADTFSADVLHLLDEAVGVFGETVGGLDAVLEEVEPRISELALESPKQRATYVKALKKKVQAARDHAKRAYDPLLDLRSFDQDAVFELVDRASARAGIEVAEDEPLEASLWAIARDLDERLEECVTELAERLGIRVDTDTEVDAFQAAFHFGHALNIEALPGFDIAEERTVLGTFWRETAIEQEEIEYFATGHPMVEALFGFLRDGPSGRNGARYIEVKNVLRTRGVEFLFHVTTPQPGDTSIGAKVPSRQLSRFLKTSLLQVVAAKGVDGRLKIEPSLLKGLTLVDGKSLKGNELAAAFPDLPTVVDEAVLLATKAALTQLEALKAQAHEAIEDERDLSMLRLKLSMEHQGVATKKIEAALTFELEHYDALLLALQATTVTLDSACAFVINR
jgi:ATP-dependent helicase HepA